MKKGIIYQTEKQSAAINMATDAQLLKDLGDYSEPILHLYDWAQEAITYGHFIQPEKWLNTEYLKKEGFELAKRPTGGGFVFHVIDWAFSVLVPATFPAFSLNTLENYAFVNRMVISTLERYRSKQRLLKKENFQLLPHEIGSQKDLSSHFCMAKPTKYDVMLGGKKIAGAAQRRTKEGYLHQGAIFLLPLEENFLKNALRNQEIAHEMQNNSLPILEKERRAELQETRLSLQEHFTHVFQETVASCKG